LALLPPVSPVVNGSFDLGAARAVQDRGEGLSVRKGPGEQFGRRSGECLLGDPTGPFSPSAVRATTLTRRSVADGCLCA
jgi:hypothetical protein